MVTDEFFNSALFSAWSLPSVLMLAVSDVVLFG